MSQVVMFSVSAHSLHQWRSQAQRAAIAQDISPDEVDWLLRELAQVDRLALHLSQGHLSQGHLSQGHSPDPSSPPTDLSLTHLNLACDLPTLAALWDQRLTQSIPLQYLVGSTPWRNFQLQVSPAVLIPRPETELIIDLAQAAAQGSGSGAGSGAGSQTDLSQGIWADLGTGSGAIALGLAQALPQAQIYATDTCAKALAVAQLNAQAYGLDDRITFLRGDWLEPLARWQGALSAIVSNPPYIPSAEVLNLQPEVRLYEPHLALDGGEDGLDDVRELIAGGLVYLKPGGLWLVEHMAGQSALIRGLLAGSGGYGEIRSFTDWGGLDRFVMARRG
jgi:release factor glutamine methyltransferase